MSAETSSESVQRGPAGSAQVPVLVLGSGITALGVVRTLGRAGIPRRLLCQPGDFAARSRFASPIGPPLEETPDPLRLAEGLERLGMPRAVLMACSDHWSAAVAGLPADVRERYPASIASTDVLDLFVDKARFAGVLRRFDVPHPRTIELSGEADLDQVDAGSLPGFFLKPCNSQLFTHRYRRKAFPISDRADAAARLLDVTRAGLQAVLQEYIPGPPTAHYFLDGFVDRTGRILARFARRRMRMFPPDFGNSTLTVSVPLAEVGRAASDLDRLLLGVGYRGIFSAEFKRDERDGLFKVLEVNTRPWWYVEFASLCGVDVCRLAYADALGLPAGEIREYRLGARFVLLPQDWQAFWHLRSRGEITVGSWLRSWVGARQTILRRDDPVPALALPAFLVRRRARSRRRTGAGP